MKSKRIKIPKHPEITYDPQNYIFFPETCNNPNNKIFAVHCKQKFGEKECKQKIMDICDNEKICTQITKDVMKNECKKGYYYFYHGMSPFFYVFQELYRILWQIVHKKEFGEFVQLRLPTDDYDIINSVEYYFKSCYIAMIISKMKKNELTIDEAIYLLRNETNTDIKATWKLFFKEDEVLIGTILKKKVFLSDEQIENLMNRMKSNDDYVVEDPNLTLSVNLALYGNYLNPFECSIAYFMAGESISFPTNILESTCKFFGFHKLETERLYSLAQQLDTESGMLMQILIPKNIVNDIVYLSEAGGTRLRSTKGFEERLVTKFIDDYDDTAPQSQARILLTKNLMLNNESGIKIFRHVNKDDISAFNEITNNIMKMLKKEVLTKFKYFHNIEEIDGQYIREGIKTHKYIVLKIIQFLTYSIIFKFKDCNMIIYHHAKHL